MRYKLLAFDLDGTALGSDPHRFAPGLAEAAAAAAEAGCVVAAATGRPAACLPADLDPTPPWLSWLVLCDGAEVRDAHSGACLWRKAFSAAALAQVEAAAARCGLPAEYIDREGLYHMTDAARRAVEASGVGAFHKGIVARRRRALAGPAAGLAGEKSRPSRGGAPGAARRKPGRRPAPLGGPRPHRRHRAPLGGGHSASGRRGRPPDGGGGAHLSPAACPGGQRKTRPGGGRHPCRRRQRLEPAHRALQGPGDAHVPVHAG